MRHYKEKHIYVGVDLHKHTHTAVIVNCWNEKLGEIQFNNIPNAFPDFLQQVKGYAKRGVTPLFGLEDVGGYGRSLAVYLLEEKQKVKEVNTALSYAERKSYPTTKKNDSWDAECLAKILLNKLDILPDANVQDVYWTMGQLVSRRTGLIRSQISLKNQLHAQLSHHYPSYKKFFSDIDGKCALVFWHTFPSPQLLEDMTAEELAKVLRKASHNTCSTKKAEEILALVKRDGDTTRDYQHYRDFLIQSFVRDLRFKQEEMKNIHDEIKTLLGQLDYKLETMPGIDLVTAAYLIAEIGDINRFPSADKLARFAGVAPVLFSSAGKGKEQKSKQGNRILHGLFYNLAVQQVQVAKGSRKPRNPFFHEYYHRKIAEGKSKKQALVCVMRRLVNIIYGMMKNKTEFVLPDAKSIEKQVG
ncbi:IS110 family RNA-guided transposase [Paenibacillus hexagrammi]|uniref:IS110 family transposase n=1 Tax=Paenibacillus hexagrammi TaxID=2908839 RepID=A0ABY3SQY8_9BACL|nr:IS110 family transposase [Paenibacillus sp. YPD9-1]UJF36438.1 IS110 family transposase [Paenibacillus sp. YPD9-1]